MYRTDLAAEAHEMSKKDASDIEGVIVKNEVEEELSVTTVEVINENGAKAIGKAMGKYITVEVPDIKYSSEAYEKACHKVAEKIKELADVNENTVTLVVGLGNDDITPDRLGTSVFKKIMVTKHMKQNMPELCFDGMSTVCAVAPGVLGTTGMESAEIVKSISENLKPDLIIAVDALAAVDYSRIGVTIQLSDAGIQPGAGVGNNRNALSRTELGIPVIAMGVPTVVDARTLIKDDTEPGTQPLIVTPRDIDLIVKRCACTISNSINLALQKGLSLREIEEYIG